MKDNPNTINFQHLSNKDKSKLKSRIHSSVSSYRIRKRRFRFVMAAAAVLVLFLSITIFSNTFSESSAMENVVKNLEDNSESNQIRLVLTDDESVEIAEDDASITYSENGSEVKIGNANSYKQKTSESGAVIYNTLIVPYGKRSEITLSDGSKVWLNSGSTLVFPSKFETKKREVYLEGEAIFEVAHNSDQPFFVQSKSHTIEVLGTVFNVSNYKNDETIFTVLKSGSVQINYKTGTVFKSEKSRKIVPGQMAIFTKADGDIQTASVEVARYFSWRDGIFIFSNDSLESIMKKISRYYNVEIEIQNEELANETFSGYLDVKDDISKVMQTIKDVETSNFNYEFSNDNKIIINSNHQ